MKHQIDQLLDEAIHARDLIAAGRCSHDSPSEAQMSEVVRLLELASVQLD